MSKNRWAVSHSSAENSGLTPFLTSNYPTQDWSSDPLLDALRGPVAIRRPKKSTDIHLHSQEVLNPASSDWPIVWMNSNFSLVISVAKGNTTAGV